MSSWKETLSGDKMQAVASYILSMEPAKDGKPADGDNIESENNVKYIA